MRTLFAFCRAFRALLEATEDDGLIRFAVIQLVQNASGRASACGSTWFGRLRRRVRTVWPDFDVSVCASSVDSENAETVAVSGVPNISFDGGDFC